MTFRLTAAPLRFLAVLAALLFAAPVTQAQEIEPPAFTVERIVAAGGDFFGEVSTGLASVIERAFANYGTPDAYILGQEAGGAIIIGVRYGEGILTYKDGRTVTVYWQGPSLGFDLGADGSRTMILVYGLTDPDGIFREWGGVNGSAYVIGGFGMTVLTSDGATIVPVRAGVGARVGVNVGYLGFTRQPTWNPF